MPCLAARVVEADVALGRRGGASGLAVLLLLWCALLAWGGDAPRAAWAAGPQVGAVDAPDRSAAAPEASTAAAAAAAAALPGEGERLVLELLNQARTAEGLRPVGWDPVAAVAARRHAEEMVEAGYIAHWDRRGLKPPQRHNEAGGSAFVMENLGYGTGYRGDAGIVQFLHDTTRTMLAETPPDDGHRRNILDAAHTAVGIGIASAHGRLAVAHEFTNHYVRLDTVARRAPVGAPLTLSGQALPGYRPYAVQVSWEPAPAAMTVHQLSQTASYSLAPAYQTVSVQAQGGSFSAAVPLDYDGKPGVYSLLLWVQDPAGKPVPASLVTLHAD
jgi:uncharacterized protein YkwD